MRKFICLIIAALIFPISSSFPVERGCLSQAYELMMGAPAGYGFNIDFRQYQNDRSVLFLSDGMDPRWHFSLGRSLRDDLPNTRIVSTDYTITRPFKSGNFTEMQMDNTKPFPFKDNEFDAVVMRRGLCVCHDGRACGGFCPISAVAAQFFKEAIRVMNKKNPKARVVLHGSHGVTRDIVEHWKKILQQLEAQEHVKATIHYDRGGLFNSISITPAPGVHQ